MQKSIFEKVNKIMIALFFLTTGFLLPIFQVSGNEDKSSVSSGNSKDFFLLDMVHHNPGEPLFKSSFLNPEKLASWGYTGQVFHLFDSAQFGITWESLDSSIFPQKNILSGSSETKGRLWVENKASEIEKKYKETQKAGLSVYCMMDMIVLPKSLMDIYETKILDERKRIDIHKKETQKIIRILIREIFNRFPQLDGIVVRTGETYLHDAPYHAGGNPILRGPESHVVLINLLREEICVKRNKRLIYRTWSFDGFHTDPEYYLNVTNMVKPHPNLVFSIKHTKGDFWRKRDFNPTIMKGSHRQIVEVQCQREYEGKGAHPCYIGKGVLDGWEEYHVGMKKRPFCLNDIANHPNFAGVWTWSRGGGWQGPYIKNEFWCELNAFVVSRWALDPKRSEEEIMQEFTGKRGFDEKDAVKFRNICLLSEKGIFRGRTSFLVPVDDVWTRDQFMEGVHNNGRLKGVLENVIRENKMEPVLAEKREATVIWMEIEKLAASLNIPDKELQGFIACSASYGRFKYEIFETGWTILLYGLIGDKTGKYNVFEMNNAFQRYDNLWKVWRYLYERSPSCATLYEDTGEYGKKEKGMGYSVEYYRKILKP